MHMKQFLIITGVAIVAIIALKRFVGEIRNPKGLTEEDAEFADRIAGLEE